MFKTLRHGHRPAGRTSAIPWASIRAGIQIVGALLIVLVIHGSMLERDIADRELAEQQAIMKGAEAALVACLNHEAIHIGEGEVVFCDLSKEIQL